MDYETIVLDKEEGIATITLNRPEKRNALNDQMADELIQVFTELAYDNAVRAVVITGKGGAFCAGADIYERFAKVNEKIKKGELNIALVKGFGMMGLLAMQKIKAPIIASVDGPATGFGCALAGACDIRIASERARFGMSFVLMGLTPDFGSTFFLPRIIGTGQACEMIFTGKIIDAKEAERIGLVNRVVPEGELGTATYEIAKAIASGPAIAIEMSKQGVYQAMNVDLSTQVNWENFAMNVCRQTEDHVEATQAFLEKRKPTFKGE